VIIIMMMKTIVTVITVYQVNPIAKMISDLIINYLKHHLAISQKQFLFDHLSLLLLLL